MTDGPRRLLDDPDFRWETGCELESERATLGPYDLSGSKAAMLARLAAPAAAGAVVPSAAPASLGLFARVLAGTAVVGTAVLAGFWLGSSWTSPALAPSPAVDRVEVVEKTAPATVIAPVEPIAAPVPADEPAPPPPPVQVQVQPSRRAAAAPAPAIASPDPVLPAADPIPSAPVILEARTSDLGAQLAVYDAAVDALQSGDAGGARRAFSDYLSRWPEGELRPEAQLGLLQATSADGDAVSAEKLAFELQSLPALAGRRSEILRLRAESLVLSGRCGEAVVVALDLSAKDSSEVRRACRSQRREEP